MKPFAFLISGLLTLSSSALLADNSPVTVEVEVPAMMCSGCSYAVTQQLKKLSDTSAIYVDPISKKAIIEVTSKDAPGKTAVYGAVKKTGYEAKGYHVLSESFSAAKAKLSE